MGNENLKELRERYMELAGMLKEEHSGTSKTLKKMLHRFALQEGVKVEMAREYFNVLQGADLVSFSKGRKTWKYNSEEEWELFQITVFCEKKTDDGGD